MACVDDEAMRLISLLFLSVWMLTACGQKGPLYLPAKTPAVPAVSAETPAEEPEASLAEKQADSLSAQTASQTNPPVDASPQKAEASIPEANAAPAAKTEAGTNKKPSTKAKP